MWILSSSSDRRALDIVDGAGVHAGQGPHYSRRTPGSKTFTGIGREIVLVSDCGSAVWACVEQQTPAPRGTGSTRGRGGISVARPTVFRNMIFRRLGGWWISSEMIRMAFRETLRQWLIRYESLPTARLRTEIDVREVKSMNPGYSYMMAGWAKGDRRRHKLFLYAPESDG